MAADEAGATRLTALDLASALIKIGRLVPHGSTYKLPAGAYLIEPEDGSLATRIEALIAMRSSIACRRSAVPVSVLYGAAAAFVALVLAFSTNMTFLRRVHDSTEKLLAFLQ